MLKPELSFINETRLRNGVEEIEHLTCTQDTVSIHDPDMCQIIRDNLKVEVFSFTFRSNILVAMHSAIRSELENRLDLLDHDIATLSEPNKEVLIPRPNFYGVGINLRVLWKRLFL